MSDGFDCFHCNVHRIRHGSRGPIMEPELRNILVIPVAPHLCLERGIVLDENDVVEIRSSS